MFNLIPREVRFFDLFEQQSQHIIRAAALPHERVHNFGDARAKLHAIKEVETTEIITDRCEDVVIEGIILKMA